ncbi:unnamed protein product [Clavelina lepadiformis]|uniref:EF-hand domain-containing protein n=1 Tax=Clavelina lepadiformis TaxID=159417 RepID=A0ABP0GHS7_CLALP
MSRPAPSNLSKKKPKVKKRVSFSDVTTYQPAPLSSHSSESEVTSTSVSEEPSILNDDVSALLRTLLNIGNLKSKEEIEREKREKEEAERKPHPSPSLQGAQILAKDALTAALKDFETNEKQKKSSKKNKRSAQSTTKNSSLKPGKNALKYTSSHSENFDVDKQESEKKLHPTSPKQGAQKLAEDALTAALKDFETNDEQNKNLNINKLSAQSTTKDSPLKTAKSALKSTRSCNQNLGIESRITSQLIKPWYSSSTFEKNVVEFLQNSESSTSTILSTSASSSRSSQAQSSLSSSSSSLVNNKTNQQLPETKIVNKSDTELSQRKRPQSAYHGKYATVVKPVLPHKPTNDDLNEIIVRGSKMSQHEKPASSKINASRKRTQSIDVLAEFMMPVEARVVENALEESNDEATEEIVKEVVEPPVFVGSYPSTVGDDTDLPPETKTSKDFRSHSDSISLMRAPVVGRTRRNSLSSTQLGAFHKLFSRFDQTQSGGISAKELYQAVLGTFPDIDITLEEVEEIHKEFNIKETGEIDFDEFLTAVTQPQNFVKLIHDEDQQKMRSEMKLWEEMVNSNTSDEVKRNTFNNTANARRHRKSIFFKVLKTVTKEESMNEIRQYYINKVKKVNDHVVQYYSAGQRCLGISFEEIMKRFKSIKKELHDERSRFANWGKMKSSPYAQPLCFNHFKREEAEKKKVLRKKLLSKSRAKSAAKTKASNVDRIPMKRPKSAPKNLPKYDHEIQFKTERRSSPKPTKLKKSITNDEAFKRIYSAPVQRVPGPIIKRRAISARTWGAPARRPKISEFVCTPKAVALPKYLLQDYPQTFNYDDLPEVRQKTEVILDDYYNKLKKVASTNSRTVYKKFQVQQMTPIMRDQFKQSYLAYTGEVEPFVVSPWLPYPVPSHWIPYPPLGRSQPKAAWV